MPHVTFTPAGRMGNFMLEAMCAFSYAMEHNLDFTVPLVTTNEKWSPIYLKHLQDHSFNPYLHTINLWESCHEYVPLEFREEWRSCNISVEGYRQSFKYCDKHRAEILYAFDLPYKKVDAISLHARFGDYLTVKDNAGKFKHVVVDEDYIMSAIKLVNEKTGLTRVKVFSDDIPLFKQKFAHLYDFEYSNNTNEYDDFVEISHHHSNINSSSTFSLCAAWFNQNPDKVVVTQKHWFNESGWMGLNTEDIVPPNFIKL